MCPLPPSPSPLPETDAEMIQDEVQRQVTKCTCVKQYRIHKIGEGKYRVSILNNVPPAPSSPSPLPETDAEMIQDEVQRQVTKCTCVKQYRIHKIGEGKYRVSILNNVPPAPSSPSPLPETDAEMIQDEVQRQVTKCTCVKQYRIHKIGEGKYRVSILNNVPHAPSSPSPLPETDAEMIQNEVKRQVTKCTCVKQYRIYKIGEGKYKVSILNGPSCEKTCLPGGLPTRRVSNQCLQLQRLARKLKFRS